MMTAADFLSELHLRGAKRIRCVRFRNNRSTIWSITGGGTVLNVHAAYRTAPADILDAFAALATARSTRSRVWHTASDRLRNWPELEAAMDAIRLQHQERAADAAGTATACCGTPEQRAYLRALYSYFNHTRFEGKLPADLPVRLSSRMRSALGHMLPGCDREGSRQVVEIALNVDLMLPGNGAERADTLLHEMAHVADYLESGSRGHGASWREWATRVGCRPTTLYDRPVRFRRRRRDPVHRVPPLPPAVARCSDYGQSQPKAPAVSIA